MSGESTEEAQSKASDFREELDSLLTQYESKKLTRDRKSVV